MGLIQHDSNFDLFNENRDSGNKDGRLFQNKTKSCKRRVKERKIF